ncbi:hypothetical protein PVAND_013279 [Polypedilum vanderplanki]|uniref:Deoxynucleoside kinase domain-containing protein n=1 Tax=Polypedilum vanderplanki TaxID=319348 RepID=A0A9J6CP10_POLVA|nr:hypothetical protein PVAND_013279 [Polypedilum vanderplanki]
MEKKVSEKLPYTVFIEGNIGSGKSTFLEHFSKFKNASLIPEPLEEWKNLNGINLLDLLYKDPQKWYMAFQSYVMLTQIKNHIGLNEKPIKLIERSIYSGQYCFLEQMHDNKILETGMYHVLQDWYNFIYEHHKIQCDLIVYLRTNPEIVYKRMKQRGRTEESKVTLQYLKDLHNHHENWLIHGKFNIPAPVLIIDANLDRESILKEYEEAEKMILGENFEQNRK